MTELDDTQRSDGAAADEMDHDDSATPKKGRRTFSRRWSLVTAATLTTCLAAATAWFGFGYHSDKAISAAQDQAGPAAAEAVAAILSYRPDTVAADLARARSHLGGDFAGYFDKLGTDVVTPAATRRHMSSKATVTATSVVSADVQRAVALVFVDQLTTADDLAQPTTTSSSLRLELRRTDGRWLVTELDTL